MPEYRFWIIKMTPVHKEPREFQQLANLLRTIDMALAVNVAMLSVTHSVNPALICCSAVIVRLRPRFRRVQERCRAKDLPDCATLRHPSNLPM